jgi:phosphate transport system permease protein
VRLGDRIFRGLAEGSGILIVAIIAAIGIFLLWRAIPALARNEENFLLFGGTWITTDTSAMHFGILDLLQVTVFVSVFALVLAMPVALGIAIYLTNYASKRVAGPLAYMVDLLAAVPSIIYGFWGIKTFGPVYQPFQDFLRDKLGWFPLFSKTTVGGTGTILFIGIVLAIMILPIVTALSREVFAQTPVAHKEGALALGATKWEMIRTAVLPFGKPGVISAAMLALGRALGETIAVTIIVSALAPGTPWSWSLLNGGETFASRIANNAAEFDSPSKTGAFIAAGLVLFILTFVVNAIARIVIERRKAFAE